MKISQVIRTARSVRTAEPKWSFLATLTAHAQKSIRMTLEFMRENNEKEALSSLLSALGYIGTALRYFGHTNGYQQINNVIRQVEMTVKHAEGDESK